MATTRARILASIIRLYDQTGYPPTYRELETEVGIVLSAVHYQVDQLIQEGLVRATPYTARALVPTAAGRDANRPT